MGAWGWRGGRIESWSRRSNMGGDRAGPVRGTLQGGAWKGGIEAILAPHGQKTDQGEPAHTGRGSGDRLVLRPTHPWLKSCAHWPPQSVARDSTLFPRYFLAKSLWTNDRNRGKNNSGKRRMLDTILLMLLVLSALGVAITIAGEIRRSLSHL